MENNSYVDSVEGASDESANIWTALFGGVLFIPFLVGVLFMVIYWDSVELTLDHKDNGLSITHESFWGLSKKKETYRYNSDKKEWMILNAKDEPIPVLNKEATEINL